MRSTNGCPPGHPPNSSWNGRRATAPSHLGLRWSLWDATSASQSPTGFRWHRRSTLSAPESLAWNLWKKLQSFIAAPAVVNYIKIHQNTSKVKGNNLLKTYFASFLFTSKPLLFPKRMQQIQSRQASHHGAKFLHRPTRPVSQHRSAGGRTHRRRFGAAQVPRASAPSGSGGILPCQEALLEAQQATAPGHSQHSCQSCRPNTRAPH